MAVENWQQLKDLFQAALDLPHEERASFLDRSCSDRAMRSEVESLLASHQRAGDLLETHALHLPLSSVHSSNRSEGAEGDARVGGLVGPYRLIAKIGEGGMGSVYRAIRIDDHYLKQVAIKLLRPGLGGEHYLRRFRNERQIMASLDHPNIARLLDGGATLDGLPYFVLEYIEGSPIDEYCDSHRLSTAERLKLFRAVCSAVQYAHQHLVVHRDLKPGNILITNEGVPKLLDFGIAKLLDPELFLQTAELTATAVKPMTPEYASPEQVRGEAITTASDVYSLGVLLYRLLTGHAPYRLRGQPLSEMARIICETEPVRPSLAIDRIELGTRPGGGPVTLTPELVSGMRAGHPEILRRRLAGDVDNIVMKALRKEPERRYNSVEKLSEDIARHLEGLPVFARKDTIRYRTGKFVRRNKVSVMAGGLILLTLVGGIISTSHEARVARGERARAEQRFNDVRKLANSMIFGLDDSIRDLPGAIPARKLLVNNATLYLDKLAREAKGDLSLQKELAAAYERLGDVQGNPVRSNIGDTPGALQSYRKAVAIREGVAAANPRNDDEQYDLAESHRLLGFLLLDTGDLADALDHTRQAQGITEQLAKNNPSDEKIAQELANVYKLMGDIEGGNGPSANLGNIETAFENHEKALAIVERLVKAHAGDVALQASLARIIIRTGDDLLKTGKRPDALRRYASALEIFHSLSANPDSMYAREIAVTEFRMGDAHAMDGNWTGALAAYRRSLEKVQSAAASDPDDALARADLAENDAAVGRALANTGQVEQGRALLRRGLALAEREVAHDPKHAELARVLAFIHLWTGQVLGSTGNHRDALAQYRSALTLFQQLALADPQDVDVRLCTAAVQLEVGRALMRQGDIDEAANALRASLAIMEPMAALPSPNQQLFYTTADVDSAMGDALMQKASGNNIAPARQVAYRTEAMSWYQRSAAVWHRIQNPAKLGPDGFYAGDPQLLARKITDCTSMLLKGAEQ
ncbi:MAG TPA: protein kinase [Candidatus Sulfotelmatobacter sp.]|nr:protein kinase [Candidatus Sulfotelmatobacter sp.]